MTVHENKLLITIGKYEHQLVCVCVCVCLSARPRTDRAEPKNNRSYSGSNLVRDTGYPNVYRRFPHSLHLNTRKLPQIDDARFFPNLFQRPILPTATRNKPQIDKHTVLRQLSSVQAFKG